MILLWRRLDLEGLERLELRPVTGGFEARGTVLSVETGGLRIDHHWRIGQDWRALHVTVERWNAAGHDRLELARTDRGWDVDGAHRPDLDGAEEPDLSVTPFCNSLPIKRLDQSMTLDTAYIDGAALSVQRSSQRYERIDACHVRYIDLGVAKGFEAELELDADDLVVRYEHLFERI